MHMASIHDHTLSANMIENMMHEQTCGCHPSVLRLLPQFPSECVCVAAAGGVVDHSDVHSKDAWQRFNKQVMQGDAFVHFELAPQHTS